MNPRNFSKSDKDNYMILKMHTRKISASVKDLAITTIAVAQSTDGVFIDLDTAGDNFPENNAQITNELRTCVEDAIRSDCDFLYLV
jgi:hypothetical protein